MIFKLGLLAAIIALTFSAGAYAQYDRSNEDCADARSSAASAASDLSDYARRLGRCAEAGDYSDNCDTEFRRVRSAHDDYESATSDVALYCD